MNDGLITRRQLLARTLAGGMAIAGASVLGSRRPARAIGEAQRMRILRVRHGGGWESNRGAEDVLAEEIRLRTSIDMADESRIVQPTSPRLYDSLFALVAGDGPFSLSDDERRSLTRWVGLGGLLLFDNTGLSAPSPSFDRSVRRELGRMFPQNAIERVSPDHVIYRSFYRLDYPAGRAIHKPFVEGVQLGKRQAVIINHNDLTGACVRDEFGAYRHVPSPGGDNQREMALRFGVNLMMYAACLHYKDDQVHIDYLLRKRKWKIKPPE